MTTLTENLEYKDMVGIVKPTLYIDAFESKMGEDEDIVTLSFYIRQDKTADDLVSWFEKGYEFVLDATRAPGEVKPNRFLVYLEIERKVKVIRQIEELLSDLNTLTEFELEDWTITYKETEMAFDFQALMDLITLNPHDYKQEKELELNEMRTLAHLPIRPVVNKKDKDLRAIQIQAGII